MSAKSEPLRLDALRAMTDRFDLVVHSLHSVLSGFPFMARAAAKGK